MTWIYSAQITTLTCRILALAVLYLFGRIFVGPKKSFIALLVLIFLPYPAHMGSDALRDWPILFFVSSGLLFILSAMRRHRWWSFVGTGLTAGLGYTIHPLPVQGLLYGLLWLLYRFLYTRDIKWRSLFLAIVLLLVSFTISAAPGIVWQGRLVPQRFDPTFDPDNSVGIPDSHTPFIKEAGFQKYSCGIRTATLFRGLWKITERLSENMMWFFLLPLVLGLVDFFRSTVSLPKRFLFVTFILFNFTMVLYRYALLEPAHVSHRYILGITVFFCFFIPSGLEVLAQTLCHKGKSLFSFPIRHLQTLLLVIGIAICLPKLFKPIRYDKTGYRDAADWLRLHSPAQSVVTVPDHRIALYANRTEVTYYLAQNGEYLVYHVWQNGCLTSTVSWPDSITHVVEVIRTGQNTSPFGREMEPIKSFALDPKDEEKGLIKVYKVLR
ncbi:MAG: glycosyltransferase family 39 protein [Sedimentisphaerales bacterium]|nr:glycosyltransferase family 39 protein [Sedimentisphaerales bacterium]